MMITRDNYELWFLDYLEGTLDEKLIDDFLEFLRENPDLGEELHLFEAVVLKESDLVFSDKKKLYKDAFDSSHVFDSTAIGFFEGDLDQDEQLHFNNYLKQHPEKFKELQLFKLTKLTPDSSLLFKNKQLLYRQPVIRLATYGLLRIASVIIFIFAFSRVLEKPSEEMISGKPLTIFASDNQATRRSGKMDKIISAPERPINGSEIAGHPPGNSNLAKNHPESPGSHEFQPTIESVREYHPALHTVAYVSPFLEIQTPEPELLTPSFYYEMAAIDEPVNVSLSQKFIRKIGLSGINPGKVLRWGLSLATGLTKEKFNYSTNASGEIIALNLDTRLVGLSIPVNRE